MGLSPRTQARGREWFRRTWFLGGRCFLPVTCPGYSTARFNHSHLGLSAPGSGLLGPGEGPAWKKPACPVHCCRGAWKGSIVSSVPLSMQDSTARGICWQKCSVRTQTGYNPNSCMEPGAVVKSLMVIQKKKKKLRMLSKSILLTFEMKEGFWIKLLSIQFVLVYQIPYKIPVPGFSLECPFLKLFLHIERGFE